MFAKVLKVRKSNIARPGQAGLALIVAKIQHFETMATM
jgi:hypothetical protein